ncbi:MAG: type II 3-dehydroquinate dehydratase [Actinomycetota bacterium]
MNVLYLFGPSLGALGTREPETYGSETLADIMTGVTMAAEGMSHAVEWRQSDHEGDLVGWLLGAADEGFEAIVVNPGALTHYSYALRDAVEACPLPAIEVHMTNIFAREEFRRHSVVSPVCRVVIAGAGAGGYRLALEAFAWIAD